MLGIVHEGVAIPNYISSSPSRSKIMGDVPTACFAMALSIYGKLFFTSNPKFPNSNMPYSFCPVL
jgi:hypothetical protein